MEWPQKHSQQKVLLHNVKIPRKNEMSKPMHNELNGGDDQGMTDRLSSVSLSVKRAHYMEKDTEQ